MKSVPPDTRPPTTRKRAGNQAETLAREYLCRQGLEFHSANFQSKTGEIDLIMQDGEMLVFVEVRFRAATEHGSPLATVTRSKQRKLVRTAGFFLQQHFGDRWPPCRFDVVGISGELDAAPEIDWVAAAFY
ncbi:MAG: YraN family protein [Pseudomonadota bacterium]|nr:YraN family protein [Pseudomonadales bacterium]MDY6918918.1 YraN family protein [Pseudomonadota bacterium]